MSVHLLDVRRPVGVDLLEPLSRFHLEPQRLHRLRHPERLRGDQEDLEDVILVTEDVGAAPADDHTVAGRCLSADDLPGGVEKSTVATCRKIRSSGLPVFSS